MDFPKNGLTAEWESTFFHVLEFSYLKIIFTNDIFDKTEVQRVRAVCLARVERLHRGESRRGQIQPWTVYGTAALQRPCDLSMEVKS